MAKDPDFEKLDLDKQRLATHVVVGEIGQPSAEGKWRFSIRLNNLRGETLFEDHCEIGRPLPPEVSTFFLDSGKTAILTNPAKRDEKTLCYVEKTEKKDIFYRELFGFDLKPLLPTVETDYDWMRKATIPTKHRMNALMWHLARNLLPRGGRVQLVEKDRAIVSIGGEEGIKKGTICKVWRINSVNSSHRDSIGIENWRILPIEVSANEVTDTQAKVVFAPTGLEALWPDVSSLEVGDIVVRKEATSPFVAILPLKYDENASTQSNARWRINPEQARHFVRATSDVGMKFCPEKMLDFLRKQHVPTADSAIVKVLFPGTLQELPIVARRYGLTHIIHGTITPPEQTGTDENHIPTGSFRLFVQILELATNQSLPVFELSVTYQQIKDWKPEIAY